MNQESIENWPIPDTPSGAVLWYASDNSTINQVASTAEECALALGHAMTSLPNYSQDWPIATSRSANNRGWYILVKP